MTDSHEFTRVIMSIQVMNSKCSFIDNEDIVLTIK